MNFTHITFNSKEVVLNSLFICKGKSFKKEYLMNAISNGACAYLSEVDYEVDIPLVLVDDVRKAMPKIANQHYSRPYQHFTLIGITGTKGKSTTTYLLRKIFETEGKKTGILSSIDIYDGIVNQESRLTTPESVDLFKHFNNAKKSNLDYLVMEVSSQGLKYNRVDEIIFDYGVFLNISEDHVSALEHSSFEDYFQSKLKLFNQSKVAVINLDSAYIDQILKSSELSQRLITFSTKNKNADYFISDIKTQNQSISFKVNDYLIELGITGLFNLENALAAIAIAQDNKVSYSTIQKALKEIRVPGRMEYFETNDKKIKVIVDYAHNSLSFENLFNSIKKEYPNHSIIIIFGCPGEKSINRRKDLGEISNRYSNKVILTTEDPGYEDPLNICLEIKQYIPNVKTEIRLDRKDALQHALDSANQKTVILFTGKGDETRQKIKDKYVQTNSDIEITKELIKQYNKDH